MKEAPVLLPLLCQVQCDQEVSVGHQKPCSPTWVLYYCGAAARAGGIGEGSCGSRWEEPLLCWSPGIPQPCNSAFIELTPLPHLLPTILGCSFIKTALQVPSLKGRQKRLEIFTISSNRPYPMGD